MTSITSSSPNNFFSMINQCLITDSLINIRYHIFLTVHHKIRGYVIGLTFGKPEVRHKTFVIIAFWVTQPRCNPVSVNLTRNTTKIRTKYLSLTIYFVTCKTADSFKKLFSFFRIPKHKLFRKDIVLIRGCN